MKRKLITLFLSLFMLFGAVGLSACEKNEPVGDFTYELSQDKSYYTLVKYNAEQENAVIPATHKDLPVKVIGPSAFSSKKITSVSIPDSITKISMNAFMFCNKLTSVHITDLAAWCAIDFVQPESNPLYYGHNLYLDEQLITTLTIPDGVSEIKSIAFYFCTSFTSVVLPETLVSIGSSAFSRCAMTEISIPDSLTTIDGYAFQGSDLKSISFGENSKLTTIGEKAFEYSDLESITFPKSLTEIGEKAFQNCSELQSVVFPDPTPDSWVVNGTPLPTADLLNGETALLYLKVRYNDYVWKKMKVE